MPVINPAIPAQVIPSEEGPCNWALDTSCCPDWDTYSPGSAVCGHGLVYVSSVGSHGPAVRGLLSVGAPVWQAVRRVQRLPDLASRALKRFRLTVDDPVRGQRGLA